MANLNSVALTGNLTQDVDRRTSTNGTEIANATIAVNGYKPDDTSFIDLVMFGKTAEVAGKYLTKGQSIAVSGRLRQESWEDKKTGQKRSKVVVVVDNLQLPPKGQATTTTRDVVPEFVPGEPIDLSEIPF